MNHNLHRANVGISQSLNRSCRHGNLAAHFLPFSRQKL